MVRRLQILKQHLSSLKKKSRSIMDDVYKEPPNPEPTTQHKLLTNAGLNAAHEEWEEPAHGMLHLELQVFTCSNWENQEVSYKIQALSIKSGVSCVQNPSTIQQHTNHHPKLQARCSEYCLWLKREFTRRIL